VFHLRPKTASQIPFPLGLRALRIFLVRPWLLISLPRSRFSLGAGFGFWLWLAALAWVLVLVFLACFNFESFMSKIM
jgi:hypothetical protein